MDGAAPMDRDSGPMSSTDARIPTSPAPPSSEGGIDDASTGMPDPPDTGVTPVDPPDTGVPPDDAACTSHCALGESCDDWMSCLSMRCDDVCQPSELDVSSDGIDAISTSIKVHIDISADPAVPTAWSSLAVLYFFTVERRDDFVVNYVETGVPVTSVPTQVSLTDWILVMRPQAPGNVPSTGTVFDVQFRSDPWLPETAESNDNSNDFSYREDLGANDQIVLCKKSDGAWKHIQGRSPDNIADPCQYVENCDAAILCDEL